MENKTPKVSVIVPNYNHEKYLRQRIESILNQTFQNFELILLDDCSTDNSREIIREYAVSEKVTYTVFNDINTGSTFAQWRKGLSLARGKYIWIAESDDYSELTFLEKMVPLIESDPDCNITFCCSYAVDEKGNILSDDWDRNREKPYTVNRFDGKAFVKARMLFNNSIYNAGMVLFRRSVLDKVGEKFADYRYCGDWFFWSHVCMQGNVIRYCDKLNYFRQHSNKATPRAKSEGLIFTEGKIVIEDMIKSLELTPLQASIIKGRFLKRIIASKDFKSEEVKKDVLKDAMNYLKISRLSVLMYGLDKLLNFSSLDIRKNRYL
ncbi:glycosyltransferase [Prevotella sp. 10(H)]|uniref:glycosyltransferase family 2 protein n=1 Tax=Prevotella sp. 10(H) TaxID=1158294 RepID=UPI0004A6EB72|nr:glycosyltransferase [Prevotella sp. 10(H)]